MAEFIDIATDDIVEINTAIIDVKTNLNNAFAGYKASIEYIDSIEEKIAAAVVSIARNHSFKDGNKRTAVSVYYTLCDLNNIVPKDNIQDIILNIVNNKMNYEDAVKVLFDKEEVEESVTIETENGSMEVETIYVNDAVDPETGIEYIAAYEDSQACLNREEPTVYLDIDQFKKLQELVDAGSLKIITRDELLADNSIKEIK